MDLMELAARVEALTGPSDRVDAEIEAFMQRAHYPDAKAIKIGRVWGCSALKGEGRGWRAYGIHFQSIRYTASIDAALTLVPEGYGWQVKQYSDNGGQDALVWSGGDRDPFQYSGASTLALALTAAALKARAIARDGEGVSGG